MKSFLLLIICLSLSSVIHGQEASIQEQKILWTVAWSPDRQYIAVGGDQGELKLFDGKTFDLVKHYPIPDVILSRLKWHPSQQKLAIITQSTTVMAKILDVDTDTWTDLEGLTSSFRGLDWNHTGDYLALSEFEGAVSVYTTDGKRVSRFMADPKGAAGLDWHPSKNILVTVGKQIGIYNHLGDTLNSFEPRTEEAFLLCVEWHESGDFFVVGDYGDLEHAKNKMIQFWTSEGKKLYEITGGKAEYRNIRWSPDGEKLASASEAMRIWSKEGKLLAETPATEDYLWGIDWHPDGTSIITTSGQGIISLWDLEGKLVRTLAY